MLSIYLEAPLSKSAFAHEEASASDSTSDELNSNNENTTSSDELNFLQPSGEIDYDLTETFEDKFEKSVITEKCEKSDSDLDSELEMDLHDDYSDPTEGRTFLRTLRKLKARVRHATFDGFWHGPCSRQTSAWYRNGQLECVLTDSPVTLHMHQASHTLMESTLLYF